MAELYRLNSKFHPQVESAREELSDRESLSPDKLTEIRERLHTIDQEINEALSDPSSYNPDSLKQLQHDVRVLKGTVQNREIHSDLYQLTDSAIDLWLRRPSTAEERKTKIKELKTCMENLTNNHRFTIEDQRFIELFHACVKGVEQGILPSHVDKIDISTKSKKRKKAPADIISLEEVKKRRFEEDPLALAEILYPMAEYVYKGDYATFFDAYNGLPNHSQKALADHVFECGGDLVVLARERTRNKQHEICIAQGILGYANYVMENTVQGSIYPSVILIHQMMLETNELERD